MELDFKAVKALSSPTRVKILHNVLEKESTPTNLSKELDKSKSTISNHLTKLESANLIEKDEKEGRKRVSYKASRKAKAIVKGRERKVRFSITSSALSLSVALIALGYGIKDYFTFFSSTATQDSTAALSTESLNSAQTSSSELINLNPEILLFLGILFLSISVTSFLYGLTVRKLTN